jgi:hypothetical protein
VAHRDHELLIGDARLAAQVIQHVLVRLVEEEDIDLLALKAVARGKDLP